MNEAGPDFIGYYKQRIQDLFMQDELSLLPSENCQPHAEISAGAVELRDIERHANESMETDADYDSDFLCGTGTEFGQGLSDFDKDMLKAILQECVFVLNQEVEEIVESFVEVVSTSSSSDNIAAASPLSLVNEDNEPACKKDRDMPQSDSISIKTSSGHEQSRGQDKHHSLSLTRDGCLQSEEAIKSQSIKFSTKLKHMEQQLDEFLDVLVSKSRSMTHVEKVQLRWLIEQLPAPALDRVVDILGKRNPSVSKSSEKINVELDSEDHVTIWRLYYYARAVSSAGQM